MAMYGDFSSVKDFRESMEIVVRAEQQFGELPPEVREYFHNDPARLLDFIGKKENLEVAKKLGIVLEPEKAVTLADVREAIRELRKNDKEGSGDSED